MSEASSEMKIRALAPWFGSKRTLAERIIREMGKHAAYWEICAGSMSVLARVIASGRYVELGERLSRTLMHDEVFLEARAACGDAVGVVAPSIEAVGDEHVERAYLYFVYSWIGPSFTKGGLFDA